MLRLRTIILLGLTGLCGLGIAALSVFNDGMYSALCLFAFPFLVALMYLVVVIDIANPPRRVSRARRQETPEMSAVIAHGTVGSRA